MGSKHTNLIQAKKAKNDEFYTQFDDVNLELYYYREHFRGKTIFCNCDDPTWSAFYKYFEENFHFLGLKKLISTHYEPNGAPSYKVEYTGETIDGKPKREPIPLKGDGDFRSEECIELLKQADIVVTNPPFSLFREYVAQLIEYNKKFVIIGTHNAITYKEIFPLLRDNKMWLGYRSGGTEFTVSPTYQGKISRVDENGVRYTKLGFICWFTNLDIPKRHEDLILYKKYSPEAYPHYDNYDAIEVSKVKEIPEDYSGVMGVPITFMDKFNPDQFKIIGLGIANLGLEIGVQPYKPHHKQYRKEVQKRGTVDGDLYMVDVNDHPVVPFARILIKRKDGQHEN